MECECVPPLPSTFDLPPPPDPSLIWHLLAPHEAELQEKVLFDTCDAIDEGGNGRRWPFNFSTAVPGELWTRNEILLSLLFVAMLLACSSVACVLRRKRLRHQPRNSTTSPSASLGSSKCSTKTVATAANTTATKIVDRISEEGRQFSGIQQRYSPLLHRQYQQQQQESSHVRHYHHASTSATIGRRVFAAPVFGNSKRCHQQQQFHPVTPSTCTISNGISGEREASARVVRRHGSQSSSNIFAHDSTALDCEQCWNDYVARQAVPYMPYPPHQCADSKCYGGVVGPPPYDAPAGVYEEISLCKCWQPAPLPASPLPTQLLPHHNDVCDENFPLPYGHHFTNYKAEMDPQASEFPLSDSAGHVEAWRWRKPPPPGPPPPPPPPPSSRGKSSSRIENGRSRPPGSLVETDHSPSPYMHRRESQSRQCSPYNAETSPIHTTKLGTSPEETSPPSAGEGRESGYGTGRSSLRCTGNGYSLKPPSAARPQPVARWKISSRQKLPVETPATCPHDADIPLQLSPPSKVAERLKRAIGIEENGDGKDGQAPAASVPTDTRTTCGEEPLSNNSNSTSFV